LDELFRKMMFASYRRGDWKQPERGNYASLPTVFFIALVEILYYFRSVLRLDGKERGAENSSNFSAVL
jgi:hypothetical protein